MSNFQFQILDTNPNDAPGFAGGCLCAEEAPRHRGPEFVVFPATSLDSVASPHCVICTQCVDLIQINQSLTNLPDLELSDDDIIEDDFKL